MSKYVTTFTIAFIAGCIAAGCITGFSEMGRYFFLRIIAILFFVYAPIAIAFCFKAKDDAEGDVIARRLCGSSPVTPTSTTRT